MIFITKYEPPKDIFVNIYDFAFSTFDIKYDKGKITIDDYESSITYGEDFTESEAKKDFINSKFFKDYCRSKHYNLYKIEVL